MPDKDVKMKVRSLKIYYATAQDGTGLPKGCKQSQVCQL